MDSCLDIARRVMTDLRAPESDQAVSLEAVLKGDAVGVSLVDGDRLFIVADEHDAATLKMPRGQVYTAAEVRRVIAVNDPEAVAEIHKWKRQFDGVVREIRDGGRSE